MTEMTDKIYPTLSTIREAPTAPLSLMVEPMTADIVTD